MKTHLRTLGMPANAGTLLHYLMSFSGAFAVAFLILAELIERMYEGYALTCRGGRLPLFGWLVMRRRLGVSAVGLSWRLFNLGYIDEMERDWMLGEGSAN